MSILQGVKASTYKPDKHKFIIKPKNSLKENKEEPTPDYSNDEEVNQFIEYFISKSTRLKEFIDKKSILQPQPFYTNHLYASTSLKTMLKQILDKMISDRRLGKNLKGMNKSNLAEIEQAIWGIVQRQANLYQNELDYSRHHQQLKNDLRKRKQQLLEQIQRLGLNNEEEANPDAQL